VTIVNLLELELGPTREEAPAGHRFTLRSPGSEAGAKLTGITVYELEPGQGTWPYHFELGEEEWLLVIAGEVTLRVPDGERVMRAGDVACFPAGPAGAHAVRNASEAVARFAMPSSISRYGDGAVYVDTKKFVIHAPGGFHHRGWLGDGVPYWEGEV
jgi:uncharacterized cupin superfamily protein